MIIEIKGVQFANRGACLMLAAVMERVARVVPGAQIALAPHPLAPYADRARVGAWQKLPLRKRGLDLTDLCYAWPSVVTNALQRYGVVTERDIGAVLDASGFAYGDPWSDWSSIYAAGEIRRLARRGRPYVFLPQAFGPFSSRRPARKLGQALPLAALVCARDKDSSAHLRSLGVSLGERIMECPDLTIGVRGDASAAQAEGIDRHTVLLVPNSRMLQQGKASPAWLRGYRPLMRHLAETAREAGYKVAVLNHAGVEDSALCNGLASDCGGLPVLDEADPLRVKGLLGAAGAVVASRYHACVSSLSQGVPCLGTSWSHKYSALFQDFAAESCVLSDCDATAASARLRSVLADSERLSATLLERSHGLSARVELMWERVAQILAQGRA